MFRWIALCCGICFPNWKPHSIGLALTIGFGSAIVSLLAVVLFGFLYRLLHGRPIRRAYFPLWALLAVLMSASFALYFRAHQGVDQAEDRRRWLREIDAENAKSGFIKDTNGALIYVGTTNSKSTSN